MARKLFQKDDTEILVAIYLFCRSIKWLVSKAIIITYGDHIQCRSLIVFLLFFSLSRRNIFPIILCKKKNKMVLAECKEI